MTLPRRTLPGQTYLVTRRCLERRLFLKPIPKIAALTRFALGCSLERFPGIKLHGYVFMGNHMHLVLTDEDGVLSDFMAHLCAHIARAANRQWGRGDRFWSGGSFHSCELVDLETVLAKLVYVFVNPVEAGLVRRASLWPGAITVPERIKLAMEAKRVEGAEGGAGAEGGVVIERPNSAFYTSSNPRRGRRARVRRRETTLPESVRIEEVVPPGVEGDPEVFWGEMARRVAELEGEIQARIEGEKRRFKGRTEVLRRKHTDPQGTSRPTFERAAPVACVGDAKRRREAWKEVRAFRRAYRVAREEWLEGVAGVVFPRGTNQLWWRFGVPTEGRDPRPGLGSLRVGEGGRCQPRPSPS